MNYAVMVCPVCDWQAITGYSRCPNPRCLIDHSVAPPRAEGLDPSLSRVEVDEAEALPPEFDLGGEG